MDKNLDTLYDLCETISRELEESNEKIRQSGGKLTAGDVEYIDKLTHSLKSIKTTIAMMEAEEKGYSGTYWDGRYYFDGETSMEGSSNRGGGGGGSSNARGGGGQSGARGRGSNARRDSRGRYSSEYSRADAREDMKEELRDLMQDAPDERTKKKLERFINEL